MPGDGTRGPEITSVSALKKSILDPRGSGLLFFMFIRRPQPYTYLGIEWIFCIFRAPRGRSAGVSHVRRAALNAKTEVQE